MALTPDVPTTFRPSQEPSARKQEYRGMTGRFEGRVAIVTGGASGIGAATVNRLKEDGARVLIVDRNAPASWDEEGACLFQADLTLPRAAAEMVAQAVERFGRLDFLVNNAGMGALNDPSDETDEQWFRLFAINIDAVMRGCRAALPHMRAQGSGAIVNVASISGLGGDYGMAAYNASKAAVVNYSRSLAIDCARDGVRVNVVCPGLIDTPMTAPIPGRERWHAAIPMGRSAQPREIASTIAFLLSEDASFMTGSVLVADGGVTATTGQPRSPNLRPLPPLTR
ncbi:SDR family NAD(P)-dependent oxidoreductase [Sphingobium tyrosinilyticum]|uniref:SDR family NAD(P)-dependent oxidoreductase n=1 Tax=Sphingobium tyrosinilyticum TaxID=2715436 RepID=A0ABV9F1H3_9SPHN